MNKWQLICPLVAALIVGCVFVVIHGRNQHSHYLQAQAGMAGQELITGTDSSRLIHIGQQLEYRLETLRKHPSGLADVLSGDEPDLGDGQASNLIILTNSIGDRLGVRLRWDRASEKFHVLGYWTAH